MWAAADIKPFLRRDTDVFNAGNARKGLSVAFVMPVTDSLFLSPMCVMSVLDARHAYHGCLSCRISMSSVSVPYAMSFRGETFPSRCSKVCYSTTHLGLNNTINLTGCSIPKRMMGSAADIEPFHECSVEPRHAVEDKFARLADISRCPHRYTGRSIVCFRVELATREYQSTTQLAKRGWFERKVHSAAGGCVLVRDTSVFECPPTD